MKGVKLICMFVVLKNIENTFFFITKFVSMISVFFFYDFGVWFKLFFKTFV